MFRKAIMNLVLTYGKSARIFSMDLAVRIGLNEAIVLNQIDYWINVYEEKKDADHFQDGRWWVYNTIKEWQDNFPCFSERTIYTILKNLRDLGLVETANYNKAGYDRTLWYTINYEKLNALAENPNCKSYEMPSCKFCEMDNANLASPIPKNNTKNTQIIEEEEEEKQSVFENPEIAEVFKTAQAEIGVITPAIKDKILDAISVYSKDWVIEAMKTASVNGAHSWAYAEAVLSGWKAHGYKVDTRSKKTNKSKHDLSEWRDLRLQNQRS